MLASVCYRLHYPTTPFPFPIDEDVFLKGSFALERFKHVYLRKPLRIRSGRCILLHRSSFGYILKELLNALFG